MTDWRALGRSLEARRRADAPCAKNAKNAKIPPHRPLEVDFGHFGNFGTASDEMDERIAVAVEMGGVPPVYAAVFARMQLDGTPDDIVDAFGRMLDQDGPELAGLGVSAEELFLKLVGADR